MTISETVRGGLQTVFLPPLEMVVHGHDPIATVTDEEDAAYNAKCNEIILAALVAKREENSKIVQTLQSGKGGSMSAEARASRVEELKTPMIRTRYPGDDDGSEDVVSLDDEGGIVVLDIGTR